MSNASSKSFEIGFRLSNTEDPEERLEEALLWKLMHDFYGERIGIIEGVYENPIPTFGRELTLNGGSFRNKAKNPVSAHLPYWNDPAFKKGIKRAFEVVPYEDLGRAVKDIHDTGKDVFIKSTRMKHHKQVIKRGKNAYKELDAMAYSFMDGGPEIMVQEWRPMEFEFRFFIIDRQIVTWSPKMVSLTPFDYPKIGCYGYRHENSSEKQDCGRLIADYMKLIEPLLQETAFPDVSIDVAIAKDTVSGKTDIEIVEYNPMQLGQIGLFACDVMALVKKSPILLSRWPTPKASSIELDDPDATTRHGL